MEEDYVLIEKYYSVVEEFDELRAAVKPFAELVSETEGRIPTEKLSFADWHRLSKAYNNA